MKKACICVGDYVWTMTYTTHPDNTVTVLNFDKEDNDGYMFPETLGRLDRVVEDAERVAQSVIIDGNEHDIRNKQNVYTYKQPL